MQWKGAVKVRRTKIMREKIRTKLWVPLILFLGMVLLIPVSVRAEEKGTLEMNDTWISGALEEGEEDVYTLSVAQTGYITVDYHMVSGNASRIEVYSDVRSNASAYDWVESGDRENTSLEKKIAVDPGSYTLKVQTRGRHWSSSDSAIEYKIKASFAPTDTNDTDKNHSKETAQELTPENRINGLLTLTNCSDYGKMESVTCGDWYRFTLKKRQTISVRYVSRCPEPYMTVCDSEGNLLYNTGEYFWGGGDMAPKVVRYNKRLDPGTYYVVTGGWYTGRYHLELETDYTGGVKVRYISITTEGTLKKLKLTPGQSKDLRICLLDPKNAVNKDIIWTSSNPKVATMTPKKGLTNNKPTKGVITAKKPGRVIITAKAADGGGAKDSVEIIIYPKQVTSVKAVAVGGKRIVTVWDSQKNISGYRIQYSRNSKFKGAKTIYRKPTLEFASIGKLAKGKKYYVRIQAYYKIGKKTYYGDWSKASAVKVR